MPKQLALDFSRDRIRALEIDGSSRSPRIRAFGVHDITEASPGDDPDTLDAATLGDLLRSQKFTRDPAACAMSSGDCTFREMDLPFTTADQIRKVIKYEAESHLHLVDIDDVVVDFLKLREGRDGSHLLVMAYEKAVLQSRFGLMDRNGVDPLFADLHLTAVHRALEFAGYFDRVADAEADASDAGEQAAAEDELVLVLECDTDVSHLLVVHGGKLVAARAIRVGVSDGRRGAGVHSGDAEEQRSHPEAENSPEDTEFVLVDDAGGLSGLGSEDFFRRLRREVQRSLFPLGLAEEQSRLLLLGPLVRDESFVQRVGEEMDLLVEIARPFDQFDHDLAPEILEEANAEGVAALGVGLRMLSGEPGIDFRQEELHYAKRFDQLKVALACAIVMLLIGAFAYTLDDLKKYMVLTRETQLEAQRAAVRALDSCGLMESASGEELNADDIDRLKRRITAGTIEHSAAIEQIRKILDGKRGWLGSRLGRQGEIPQVPSGLELLRDLMASIEGKREEIGRLEINSFDMDIFDGTPTVQIKAWVDEPQFADTLRNALRASEIVEAVAIPRQTPDDDTGRIELQGLEVTLKPQYGVNVRGR